ncbi:hypothetical protein SPLC1_S520180 [Arthrospira platensis C1]|nr:hypothetical protein SPLC1_S520180 [Arthrospira platensis C1]
MDSQRSFPYPTFIVGTQNNQFLASPMLIDSLNYSQIK